MTWVQICLKCYLRSTEVFLIYFPCLNLPKSNFRWGQWWGMRAGCTCGPWLFIVLQTLFSNSRIADYTVYFMHRTNEAIHSMTWKSIGKFMTHAVIPLCGIHSLTYLWFHPGLWFLSKLLVWKRGRVT